MCGTALAGIGKAAWQLSRSVLQHLHHVAELLELAELPVILLRTRCRNLLG